MPGPYRVHLHIAGETRSSSRGGTCEREDPADTRSIVTVSDEGTVEEMREAVAAARAAFSPCWSPSIVPFAV